MGFDQGMFMTGRSSDEILTDPPPRDADARIAYGCEPLQFGDLRLPSGGHRHPLAVVIHGGYWQATYNLTHAGHLCIDLAQHGIATWNIEYRRLGDPGGGWPGTFGDVLLALGHVPALAAQYPLDMNRVVVIGHSAGGHLAVWGALHTTVPLRGAVSLAGVLDLEALAAQGDDHGLIERLLGGTPDEVPERWHEASPHRHLPWPIRTVIACGTADVHRSPNESTAAAALQVGGDVELLLLSGAGHFELVDPAAREWVTIRTSIQRLLQ